MIIPIILAKGAGSRLWPLSHVLYPKQFLHLKGDLAMMQATISRLNDMDYGSPIVICNEQYRFTVAEQLREVGQLIENIILEPASRNIASAIALAAAATKQRYADVDPLILVPAVDHITKNEELFHKTMLNAVPYAESKKPTTFGIVPDQPEAGCGYIRSDEPSCLAGQALVYNVAQFVEKPNLGAAQACMANGDYYWNSGMFLFQAGRHLEELKRYRPGILETCENTMNTVNPDLDSIHVDEQTFPACPEESVNYAIVEHMADTVVMPMNTGWSDIGSWSSLWGVSAHTAEGNVHHDDVISHKTENSYVYTESGLVVTVGIKDLVVVQTEGTVLIADHSAVQDVKKVAEQIKADRRYEHHIHREVYRP